MNNVILSGRYPQFAEALRERGCNVIYSEYVDILIPYERDHADMQCLIMDDTAFVLRRCERLARALSGLYNVVLCGDDIVAAYPGNVALNAAAVGKYVLARTASLAPEVRDHCAAHGYQLINVRQGYAKCSCAIVSDNAIITADKGIYNSLKETNIEVLLIEEGRVALEGADYGFIGGASGLDICESKRTLYFSGNITRHPDYERIKAFCDDRDTVIVPLTDDVLTDIGGMIFC